MEIFYKNNILLFFSLLLCCICGNGQGWPGNKDPSGGRKIYRDLPYLQDYAVRYYLPENKKSYKLRSVSVNRDGQIRILTDNRLLVPDNGSLFYPGQFVEDISYPSILPKRISAITTYMDQTFYLDDRQLFSNAWAGKIQIDHGLPRASLFAGGKDFHFLVSDGDSLVYLDRNGNRLWTGVYKGIRQIRYSEEGDRYFLISPENIAEFIPGQPIRELYKGEEITCAINFGRENKVVIGTKKGYVLLSYNGHSQKKLLHKNLPQKVLPDNERITKVPCADITAIAAIDGRIWFGSTRGAFRLNADGKYSYYAGERWLPDNHVLGIEKGPENSVLVLTEKGLSQICFKKMTLEDKAIFYEKQVREKNIRYGINCSSVRLTESYSSGQTGNQPSDNLWTGMYLAGQLFRYKVTGSPEARQNAYESFEALERLHTVTGITGLFARSFERDYKIENAKDSGWREKELRTGSPASLWLSAADHHNWTWRSTASSDQAVGQVFGLTAILELADSKEWKARALKCLDDLLGYIVDHNLYIIDVDGQPTLWGKWNPDYVNSFPENVGDRKITSSNIIAFLQTAYHFTGKEKYRAKANELIRKYGYLDNLMRPMKEIGPNEKDKLSKELSEEWNHSDDEMYFLAYWGLYPYAFSPALREKYRATIRDHWTIERPERNALWNFTYAMTGAKDFDLAPSIRYFRDYPLDLRNWSMHNSQRGDIELLPNNFRGQTTKELLPLSEIPLYRHNGQVFTLDSEGDGHSLISAGDTWLLPYWMGRYLGVISAPVRENKN